MKLTFILILFFLVFLGALITLSSFRVREKTLDDIIPSLKQEAVYIQNPQTETLGKLISPLSKETDMCMAIIINLTDYYGRSNKLTNNVFEDIQYITTVIIEAYDKKTIDFGRFAPQKKQYHELIMRANLDQLMIRDISHFKKPHLQDLYNLMFCSLRAKNTQYAKIELDKWDIPEDEESPIMVALFTIVQHSNNDKLRKQFIYNDLSGDQSLSQNSLSLIDRMYILKHKKQLFGSHYSCLRKDYDPPIEDIKRANRLRQQFNAIPLSKNLKIYQNACSNVTKK